MGRILKRQRARQPLAASLPSSTCPEFGPPTTTLAGFEEKLAAAEKKCLVDVGFWGGVVSRNTSELAALLGAGRGWLQMLSDSLRR